MKTIIYVHGFNASVGGKKITALRNRFSDYNIFGQNYNYDIQSPKSIIDGLTDFSFKFLQEADDQIFFVGSSLGGFITLNVLKNINAKAVLINPSLSPHINLKSVGNKFVEEYNSLVNNLNPNDYRNVLCFVSDGDDVIDMQKIQSFNFRKVSVKDEGHQINNFDKLLDEIENYFEHSNLIEEHGLFLD